MNVVSQQYCISDDVRRIPSSCVVLVLHCLPLFPEARIPPYSVARLNSEESCTDHVGWCSTLVRESPYYWCINQKPKGKCCEACKEIDVKIDPQCPNGDAEDRCGDKVYEDPYYWCINRQASGDCCQTCNTEGTDIKIDPECPNGNTMQYCDSDVEQSPYYWCINRKATGECCQSCRDIDGSSMPRWGYLAILPRQLNRQSLLLLH